MANPVKPIPDGYHTLVPFLTVHGAAELIDFLKQAFDAQEHSRTASPDGTVRHADLQIGDSRLMVSEATEQWKARPVGLYMYVPDTDATYRRALEAGATSLMEPGDQFYGDRNAGVQDAFGNSWWIATHVEDVAPEEMARREKEWMEKQAKG
jgi:PhnB protein